MQKKVILIYDGNCSLCCGCMKWIKQHAKNEDEFEFIKCESEERKKRFPEIENEACLEALHLIRPDNHILVGDKSLPEIVSMLRNLQWLAILFRLPIARSVLYIVYRLIANNRYIISKMILPLAYNQNQEMK